MTDNMKLTNENDEFCAVCKKITKQMCSSCKIVYYCSREHQKNDWKIHLKNCRAYELVEDSKIGRRYVTTREIEADEIVMIENKPLLVVPKLGTLLTCLNCYVDLNVNNIKPCNNCGWPLCRDCTKHGPECELTMKYRKSKVKITGYQVPNPYDGISILRALDLREKNPNAYQKLLSLQDFSSTITLGFLNGLVPWSINHWACFFKKFMKIDDLDETEISQIIGIVAINGYANTTIDHNHVNTAVYEKASYIEHNCRANCRYSAYFDLKKGSKIIIRAAMKIPKGHPITVGYVRPFQNTVLRRKMLEVSKCFNCECERCKDPTEFGTMFSAVKCLEKKCTGYLLPPTFLVANGQQIPNYVCNECKLTTSSATIDEIITNVSMKFSQINVNNVNQLKKFIDDQSKILHENHMYIFKAGLELDTTFINTNHDLSFVSDETLKEHLTLCKKLVYLLETLGPSACLERGMILYGEYKYLSTLAHRQFSCNEPEFRRLSEESKKVMTEYYRLLRHEPKGTVEANLAENARLKLEGMNKRL